MTQGAPASPTIFNIVIDTVVQAILEVVCRPQEAQNGMENAVGERNLVLYADDARLVGQEHEWVHGALAVTVDMLCNMVLEANLEKTKAMVFTPSFI